jgi:hypothetical protein
MRALADNVSKFESVHGTIKESTGPENSFPLNFGGPATEA